MNSKTLDTALLSLGVGCLVIGIFEVMSRGLEYAYLWIMLSVALWLGYSIRKRTAAASNRRDQPDQPASRRSAAKPVSVSKSKRRRK